MFTVPLSASEMPTPEPVEAVETVMFECASVYAAPQALKSGKSSELPVCVSATFVVGGAITVSAADFEVVVVLEVELEEPELQAASPRAPAAISAGMARRERRRERRGEPVELSWDVLVTVSFSFCLLEVLALRAGISRSGR